MRIILFLTFIALALTFGYLYLNRVSYFIQAIEPKLEMKVQLKDLGITPSTLTLVGLKLDDPKNNSHYQAEKITLHLNPLSLIWKPITINELIIEDATLEHRAPLITEKTVKKLLDKGLKWLAKKADKSKAKIPTPPSKKDAYLVVHSIRAKDLSVSFLNPLEKEKMIALPKIPGLKLGKYEDQTSTNLHSAVKTLLNKIAISGKTKLDSI